MQIRRLKKANWKVAIPFLGLLVFLLVVFQLQAQKAPIGIEVHPSNFDLLATPGQSQTGVIYLKNITKDTFNIRVETRNFTALGEEGQVSLTDQDTTFSLASWIKVNPQTVTVAPGQEVKYTYSITPPAKAEPGGHFGSIVFKTIPNQASKTGAAVSQEIGTIFLVRIPGPVKEAATILTFKTEKPFYEFGPVKFLTRVRNDGGVHLKPAGVITITGWGGQKKLVGLEGENVLPGAVRRFETSLPDTWLIGKYEAALDLSYGLQNRHLYATTTFWAFPVRASLVLVLVILVILKFRKRILRSLSVLIRGK